MFIFLCWLEKEPRVTGSAVDIYIWSGESLQPTVAKIAIKEKQKTNIWGSILQHVALLR